MGDKLVKTFKEYENLTPKRRIENVRKNQKRSESILSGEALY